MCAHIPTQKPLHMQAALLLGTIWHNLCAEILTPLVHLCIIYKCNYKGSHIPPCTHIHIAAWANTPWQLCACGMCGSVCHKRVFFRVCMCAAACVGTRVCVYGAECVQSVHVAMICILICAYAYLRGCVHVCKHVRKSMWCM